MEDKEKEYAEKEARILFDKQDPKAFMVASRGHFQGYPKCTYMLGCCYYDGVGVKVNMEEAKKLFDMCYDGLVKEANENDAVSMGFLGEYNRYGLGNKPVNMEEAIYWYEKAANEGIAECKYFLGEIYRDKNLPFYDLEESYKWFHKAASQGLGEAKEIIKNWKK